MEEKNNGKKHFAAISLISMFLCNNVHILGFIEHI